MEQPLILGAVLMRAAVRFSFKIAPKVAVLVRTALRLSPRTNFMEQGFAILQENQFYGTMRIQNLTTVVQCTPL